MTVFDDGAEVLFETWPEAVAASFHPESGNPVSGFNIVIDKSLRNLPSGYETQTWGEVLQIEYLLNQVGREARPNEKFVTDSDTYRIIDIIENDNRFVTVLARRET